MSMQMQPSGRNFANLIELFDKAAEKLKHPKVVFQMAFNKGHEDEKLYPLRIQRAGSGSRQPGTLNLTDNGPYGDNIWYGRIHRYGEFELSRGKPFNLAQREWENRIKLILETLADFNHSPEEFVRWQGQHYSYCVFCQSELTNPGSIHWGYGPICADKFGLPWSDSVPDAAQDAKLEDELTNGLAGMQAKTTEQPGEQKMSGFSFKLKPAQSLEPEPTNIFEDKSPFEFGFDPTREELETEIANKPFDTEAFRVRIFKAISPQNGEVLEFNKFRSELLDMVQQAWETPEELVDAIAEKVYQELMRAFNDETA